MPQNQRSMSRRGAVAQKKPPRGRRRTATRKKNASRPKLSRLQKPDDMTLEDWQRELRRQFGREQSFRLENLGDENFFSEFEVTNPESRRSYRVQIRGDKPFDNYCSCPDFATNTLGTCKHVEFTLAKLEKKLGARAAFQNGFHPDYSEVYLHYGVQREVRFRPGTNCDAKLARLASKFFDSEGVLSPEAFAGFNDFLNEAVQSEPEMRVADDAVAFVAEVRDAQHRRQRLAEAFRSGIRSAAFKGLVNVELYDYQKEGALFAARAGRCLIGDEMGLGKTIQSIAAVEIMAKLFGLERVLIVCPTSLKHQWQNEIERLTKRSIEVIGGPSHGRQKGFESDTFYKIMNYDTVHADLEPIGKWEPELVILDEAQRIKNWSTRVARSVKRINSPYAFVLTGTPLENRLEELISIVQFVDRHRLGPTFKLLHDHQERDDHGKVVGYRDLDKIGQTLKPVLVRRQKEEVLDQLPERIDSNIFVPLTPKQRQYHTENQEIVARIVAKWRRYKFLSESDQRRLMVALERMRMVCDNTYLVDHQSDHGPKAEEAATLLDETLERPDTKVVVFSQWLRMHELLVRRLQDKPWDHIMFHGGVPSRKRKDLVNRFREDPRCRIFLSTDAGGVGLNLQHASVLLNMDLPWNPAVLEQRIGRVHRLGQKQAVRVINFVAQAAIEEGMLSVLSFKKSLFAGVLDGGAKDVFLGRRLDKFMEQVEATTSAIPETAAEEAAPAPVARADVEREPAPRGRKKKPAAPAAAPGRVAAAIAENPWDTFLQAGMALLTKMTENRNVGYQYSEEDDAEQPAGANLAQSLVHQDEATGETYLKVPVPSADVVQQALQSLGSLLDNLRK